ncbi:DNA topoisomerase VI, b subunit, putative [Plasmodium malariae]|uniref:DNA topoisomerase VI, b subunit, putative n=1 Tax=Plasmodium malariae TaxID=5858 RepID=A0A1D3SMJ5_PLAMA|nr:DNA topoisomerase VI, b subunit, putative [Plasmodium malariae]SCO92955.1 DNA topoisomerase VI, b subunit, putative [Plasmodium malariae]
MDNKLIENSKSTYSFFFKNLSVTGFYEENALFMTVKELFDNSIDALCSSKVHENKEDKKGEKRVVQEVEKKVDKKVEILIREYNKNLSFYEITCRDNGEGTEIKDLEKFSEMFLTSKDKCKTSGKFGIGLKTILLYSFKTAYGFLHIKAKVIKNKIWDFMLVIDKDLNHTFVQNFKEYVDEEWKWSIEISVILKIDSKYIYDKRIPIYINLTLLWKRDIIVKCCYDNDKEFIYACEYFSNDDKNLLLNSLIGHCEGIIFRKTHLSSYNLSINVYINVGKSDNVFTNIPNSNTGFIFLIRYVNSMPLFGNNAADCSITNDCKNFLKLYGPQFGMELFNIENLNELCPYELSNLECLEDLKHIAHAFYVKRSEKSTWNTIILGIDVRGSDISFANLNKSCIKEGEYLSNLLKKCTLNLFNSVKTELPQEFESLSDYQLRQALDIYGVQLASSLSKIILKGREEFKNKIFFLLNEKKKENPDISEKEKTRSSNSINEDGLFERFYHHIKEKILSNERENDLVNMESASSVRSNKSACEQNAQEENDADDNDDGYGNDDGDDDGDDDGNDDGNDDESDNNNYGDSNGYNE